MLRKFTITGGPSTGKTSIIKELKKEFIVFPEIAREILKNKEYNQKVQEEILQEQINQLNRADKLDKIVFFDRGIPDSLAYFKYHNFPISKEMLNVIKNKKHYELVFFLDFAPYQKDEIRKETKEQAEKIHRLIYQAYENLGYKIIKVPLMSVEKRVEFIKTFI